MKVTSAAGVTFEERTNLAGGAAASRAAWNGRGESRVTETLGTAFRVSKSGAVFSVVPPRASWFVDSKYFRHKFSKAIRAVAFDSSIVIFIDDVYREK